MSSSFHSPLTPIIEKDPQLIWYVEKDSNLSTNSIFEHVLNYGSWAQVQTAIKILGKKEASALFRWLADKPRTNLKPRVKHYFNLYFSKHVPTSSI